MFEDGERKDRIKVVLKKLRQLMRVADYIGVVVAIVIESGVGAAWKKASLASLKVVVPFDSLCASGSRW